MIDRLATLCLAGSIVFAAVLPFEFRSELSGTTAPGHPPPKSDQKPAARNDQPPVSQLTATILARPLFSPTRRPQQTAANGHSELPLGDMRLSGIVITPDEHLAIFVPAGGKPLVRSEGDMISDWRVESIADQSVSLTGPSGTTTLEPKADPNLVRVQAVQAAAAAPPQSTPASANPPPAPGANGPVRPPIPIRRSNR
jgi:hypothetical protein